MRALGIVVVAPAADLVMGVSQRLELGQVQAFVPELAVEVPGEGILDRLASLDEP